VRHSVTSQGSAGIGNNVSPWPTRHGTDLTAGQTTDGRTSGLLSHRLPILTAYRRPRATSRQLRRRRRSLWRHSITGTTRPRMRR